MPQQPPTDQVGLRPASSWSRSGLRWIARLSAVTAVVLFALVLLAIQRERLVHQSTNDIVATFRLNNGYFDDRVDFSQPGLIRDNAAQLKLTLDQIQSAASDDARLVQTILPDTARLLTAARTNLRIAHALTGTADILRDTARDILGTADHADGTVDSANDRLGSIAELIDQLNTRLDDIDRKLPLPSTGRPLDPPHLGHVSPSTKRFPR